jgi:putative proton-coupled thiamine transporter YuaJ
MKKCNLNALLEASLMIALSVILSSFKLFRMPFGGAITLGSACPIILLSFRQKTKVGVASGLILGIIRIMLSFHAPPTKDFFSFVSVILLDYLIPYSALGLANVFYEKFKFYKVFLSSLSVCLIRYIFSVLSGIIIWKSLCPAMMNIVVYSFAYNSFYMFPEFIITCVLCSLLCENKYFSAIKK